MHPGNRTSDKEKFVRNVFANIQPRGLKQNPFPIEAESNLVALGTGTPHRRTLGTIEHTELKSAPVGNNTSPSPECVYFPYYLPFSDTSYGRIA